MTIQKSILINPLEAFKSPTSFDYVDNSEMDSLDQIIKYLLGIKSWFQFMQNIWI